MFSNSPATNRIILKATTTWADVLSFIGGILTTALLVFRYMTVRFQIFNSDLTIAESLDSHSHTDLSSHEKYTKKSEPRTRKSVVQPMGMWEKIKIYFWYFSPLSCFYSCLRKDRYRKRIKKIRKLKEIIQDRFDVRRIIIDIASLIYN